VENFAASLPTDEWRVSGTVRSPEARDGLRARGWDIHFFDGEAPLANATDLLSDATHIIDSVPPGPTGDPVLRHHADDIAALSDLVWLGYLSTTGVYGDRDGDWVDEESARTPSGPRGQRRVDAEDAWLKLWRENNVPTHLFRLAGIYGPGRSALDTVRQGRARRLIKPGQVFSRIHVDDIAATLAASVARPNPGQAYNLCDEEAAPPQDVIAYACDLLGVDAPPEIPFEGADLSPMAQSFYRDNKRVSNTRIKEELGVKLAWPTYREGLQGLRT
jgi:nucleoside-diphosphate-sugar epimerase